MKRWCYWVLPAVSRSYPHAKGTLPMYCSPFRHSTRSPKGTFACDLHALATPPAFDLSQDQTRHLMTCLEPPKGIDSFDLGLSGLFGATRHVFANPLSGWQRLNSKSLSHGCHEDFESAVPRKWDEPSYFCLPKSPAVTTGNSRDASS